jgi:hypothetical protein
MKPVTVSLVDWDVNRYQQWAYVVDEPTLDLFTFDATPRESSWVPQDVTVTDVSLERPHLWRLGGAETLVLESHTIELLEPFISEAGELLPLTDVDTGARLFLLNVLRLVDCLDEDASRINDLVLTLSFDRDRLPPTGLFKIPQARTTHLLHVEHPRSRDSLHDRVERLGLTGISFDPVWTSEEGALPVNVLAV